MDEWLTLKTALRRDLAGSSLSGLYLLARALLVKSERHYDAYDRAFEGYFSGLEPAGPEIERRIWDWLADRPETLRLTPEQKARLDAMLERLDLEELRRRLRERLERQTEAHRGGSRQIGTGGTSPVGHSGHHPGGIRLGGEGRGRSAVQVVGERRWRAYRGDATIGVREFEVALQRLRRLSTRLEVPWRRAGPAALGSDAGPAGRALARRAPGGGGRRLRGAQRADHGRRRDRLLPGQRRAGLDLLKRLAAHFTHSAWLNPVPEAWWASVHESRTLSAVRGIIPVYELSLVGLQAAVEA